MNFLTNNYLIAAMNETIVSMQSDGLGSNPNAACKTGGSIVVIGINLGA